MKPHYQFKVILYDTSTVIEEFVTIFDCLNYLEKLIKWEITVNNLTIQAIQNRYKENKESLQESINFLFYTFVFTLDIHLEYAEKCSLIEFDYIQKIYQLKKDNILLQERLDSAYEAMKNSEEVDQKLRSQIVSLACSLKEKEIDGTSYFIISKSDYTNIINR